MYMQQTVRVCGHTLTGKFESNHSSIQSSIIYPVVCGLLCCIQLRGLCYQLVWWAVKGRACQTSYQPLRYDPGCAQVRVV